MTEKELKMAFANNLRYLLDKRGMDRCDLLEYFPKEKKNGEVYHYTKEDIKRLKSKGNSIEKNNELGKIKRWTNGSSMPDYIELMKLCEVLECDTDYLLKDHTPISKDISAISEYMGLAPDTIEKIRNYLTYQKEILDNMVNAKWDVKTVHGSVISKSDGLSRLLIEIYDYIYAVNTKLELHLDYTVNDEHRVFPAGHDLTLDIFRSFIRDAIINLIDEMTDSILNSEQ